MCWKVLRTWRGSVLLWSCFLKLWDFWAAGWLDRGWAFTSQGGQKAFFLCFLSRFFTFLVRNGYFLRFITFILSFLFLFLILNAAFLPWICSLAVAVDETLPLFSVYRVALTYHVIPFEFYIKVAQTLRFRKRKKFCVSVWYNKKHKETGKNRGRIQKNGVSLRKR